MVDSPAEQLQIEHVRMLHSVAEAAHQTVGVWTPEVQASWEAILGTLPRYASLAEQAAKLLYAGVRNQTLADGNKRLALLCFEYFLYVNGYRFSGGDEYLAGFIWGIAAAPSVEHALAVEHIAIWLEQRIELRP